jgi:hypothetical protein
VLVAPAVGEPLAETGAPDLPAKLGLEAAAGIAGAGRHGTFYGTQLHLHAHLHARLQRAGKSSNQFHGGLSVVSA